MLTLPLLRHRSLHHRLESRSAALQRRVAALEEGERLRRLRAANLGGGPGAAGPSAEQFVQQLSKPQHREEGG